MSANCARHYRAEKSRPYAERNIAPLGSDRIATARLNRQLPFFQLRMVWLSSPGARLPQPDWHPQLPPGNSLARSERCSRAEHLICLESAYSSNSESHLT